MTEPPHTVFIGRADELAVATAVLGAAGGLVVEGEAGIGKTALVTAGLRAAGPAGPVYRAEADEMGRLRPFGVVADAFDLPRGPGQIRRDLSELLGRAGPTSGEPDPIQFRVEELLLALIEEEVVGRRGVVVIEDLHWADAASLAVLRRLARSLPGLGCALLCTTRSSPRPRELDELLAGLQDLCRRIDLGPLSEAETTELVAALVAGRPGAGLLAQAARAGGNPLYLTELVDALVAEGAVADGGAGWVDADATVRVPTLAGTILRRLRTLPPETVELLSLASVLGDSFPVTELARVADRSAVELWPILQTGVRAGILAGAGDHLAFRHQLVRDAVYHDIPTGVRKALHREAGATLVAAGAPAARVAEHLLLGATRGDREAVAWLRGTIAEVANTTPAVAAELVVRARELVAAGDPLDAELAVDEAVTLVDAGCMAEGGQACRHLLERGCPPGREGQVRYALFRSLLFQGELAAALQVATDAAGAPGLSPAEGARMLAWGAQVTMFAGDLPGALARAAAAETAAVRADDAPALVQATMTRAHVARIEARTAEALAAVTKAVQVADEDASRESLQTIPHVIAAMVLVDLDRFDEARDLIGRGRRHAETLGDGMSLMFAHLVGGYGPFAVGDWDDALADLEAAARLAEETLATGSRLAGLCLQGMIRLCRAGTDAAAPWVGAAEASLSVYEYHAAWLPWLQASCEEGRDRPEAALAVLAEAWRASRSAGLALELRILGPPLARLAAAAEPGLAVEVADALDVQSRANPAAAGLRGAARWASGWAGDDPDALLAGLADYRTTARRPERAALASDAALLLARHQRIDEARAVAGEALELWVDVGAGWCAARLRSRLRAAGLRLGSRETRRSATSGWDALTPMEVRVVELAGGERLSNPQIAERLVLSRRTVESHVSHALAKLGLRGRTELADVLASRR